MMGLRFPVRVFRTRRPGRLEKLHSVPGTPGSGMQFFVRFPGTFTAKGAKERRKNRDVENLREKHVSKHVVMGRHLPLLGSMNG